ncbi:MAG TPA: sulfite exporter TauE/SafE family protein [Methanotrichaceae archaeon]|nr:sulfite exporter TauE/SafE family protein [Methanotrichaceae archaeon]
MIELFAFAFLIIFASMLIRTVTGFGSALIAIPLLSILFGAKYAIPFILLYECLIDIMILGRDGLKVRGEVNQAWPLLVSGLIGIPLGTEILIRSDEGLLKIVIGIALIIFSILLLWNVNLRLKRDRFGSAAAGLMGGFLCGSIGMPGPPMALLLSSQGFTKEEFRKLMVIFLTVVDFLTFIYFIWIGLINADMLMQSLMLLPALALGFLAGSFVFGKVDEVYFRRLALGITLAAGILLLLVQ